MPHKDPEVRRAYLRDYYKRNSVVIKEQAKVNQARSVDNDPDFWSKRYASDKERHTETKYLKRYGIDSDTYDQMFEEQGGCCKICQTPQSKLRRRLAVDHCHSTRTVRGLLCTPCNVSLGGFRDSEELMLKVINYLKESTRGTF